MGTVGVDGFFRVSHAESNEQVPLPLEELLLSVTVDTVTKKSLLSTMLPKHKEGLIVDTRRTNRPDLLRLLFPFVPSLTAAQRSAPLSKSTFPRDHLLCVLLVVALRS